ncbi:MAG: HDOD domain-containing protein [Phycisphaerales bacterium]|nr:HDOD domain-containing protein [Phycisphaerales bacterium]
MPDKRTILFVDDEINVLQGLKRLLHPLRTQWITTYCLSGAEALERLEQEPFDVIVSDMRMPGMDGATLLAEVKNRYPNMVRIVLSGHSSQESTLRSIGVAHQFLAKPCDPDRLKRTIDDALGLRAILANESLQRVVASVASIPCVPEIHRKLVEEVQHPDTSSQRVGEIIAKDPGLTTSILRLVNSSFFGLARHVSSPMQAAAMLGIDTIRTLVLSVQVFSQFDNCASSCVSPQVIREHSTLVASVAKRIGMHEKVSREMLDAILMAGLLHDVGKLVLAQNLPREYCEIVKLAKSENVPTWRAETQVLGTTHADVGAYLLGLWGIPDAIMEAVAFHHNPQNALNTEFSPLTAVHFADVFANEQRLDGECDTAIDSVYVERLGLTERLNVWRDDVAQFAEQAACEAHGQ